ncbi:MAG: hypothetical protein ACXW4C_02695 [Nitrospira sp.]
MRILQAAVLYFLMVFGAGFVLGTGRVLIVVPLLGERVAELLEMPLMLGVIVFAARWIVRYRLTAPRLSTTLSVGFLSLGITLFAELGVGMWLRGMSATEVFLNRDPVSGTAYYISLLLFAVMPAIFVRRRSA